MSRCITLMALLMLLACKNTAKENASDGDQLTVDHTSEKYTLDLKMPDLKITTDSKEVRMVVEETVNNIEESLSKLTLKEKQLTLYEVPNTPVRIWYSSGIPVKLEHGVADDAGEIVDVFKYYIIDNQIWYSDQIFTKYIFRDKKLQFWLDENWNKNKVSKADSMEREKKITDTVQLLLSQFE